MNPRLRDRITELDTATCTLCGACVRGDTFLLGLCAACRSELAVSPGPFVTAPNGEKEEPWVWAATEYGGRSLELIERVKFAGERTLLSAAARILLDPLLGSILDRFGAECKGVLLVPIPASRRGRRRRGFDQSLLLARALAETESDGRPAAKSIEVARANAVAVTPLLTRRRGADQKHLGRSARFASIGGQLALRRNAPLIDDRPVLILDDVVTTGATMLAAREILAGAGASLCIGVALAIRT